MPEINDAPPVAENDTRYDTAAMRTYAASLREFWKELQRDTGMSREEAVRCTEEMIRTIAISNRAD